MAVIERTPTSESKNEPTDIDQRTARAAAWLLVVAAIVGIYAVLAAYGIVPAAAWSPLG